MVTYKDPNHGLEQGRVTNWLVIHSHVPIAPWRTEFSSTQKGVRIKIQVAEVETSKRKLLEIKTTQRQVDKVNNVFLTEIWWFSRNFAVFSSETSQFSRWPLYSCAKHAANDATLSLCCRSQLGNFKRPAPHHLCGTLGMEVQEQLSTSSANHPCRTLDQIFILCQK